MSAKKTLAILVGGGPAPGINAVLAAATIEARNHGLRVLVDAAKGFTEQTGSLTSVQGASEGLTLSPGLKSSSGALAAAKVWPVNDGMPSEMVDVTINKLVEIGLLKENEKPKVEQVMDRGPANAALAKLGRWTDNPNWK